MIILCHVAGENIRIYCVIIRRYWETPASNRIHSATFFTTGRTDSWHLTHSTSFWHTGNGPHISTGPAIIIVVTHSGSGIGNKPESCKVIKELSLASLNSLATCWRRAYTELTVWGERRGEKRKKSWMCLFGVSYTCEDTSLTDHGAGCEDVCHTPEHGAQDEAAKLRQERAVKEEDLWPCSFLWFKLNKDNDD